MASAIDVKSLYAVRDRDSFKMLLNDVKRGELQLSGIDSAPKTVSNWFTELVKAEKLDLTKITAPKATRVGKSEPEIQAALGSNFKLYQEWDKRLDDINHLLEAKFGKGKGWRLQPYCRNLKPKDAE